MKISHPITRSLKEQIAQAAPDARVGHARLLMVVEVLRQAVKPDNPTSAEAIIAGKKILTRVHERIVRELRQYLPQPVGMALLLNMAAALLHSLPEAARPAAQRLADHLLAGPGSPRRLPTDQVAGLCQVVMDAHLEDAG